MAKIHLGYGCFSPVHEITNLKKGKGIMLFVFVLETEQSRVVFGVMEMVMVMNLYSTFSINIFKCALQPRDLWVRSDISIYRHRWEPLSVH